MTFAGSVSPEQAGAVVVLQRESSNVSGNWFRIGVGEVGADGSYAIAHSFRPGAITVRVLVRPRRLLPGVSEPLSFELAQRQNPRLTIEASPASLSYGQALTLSGTAAGAPHEPVTLLARTRRGRFSAVATAATDAGGKYTFAAGSPAQNTWYRVARRHTSSMTLLVRVKPLITAQVPSPTAGAGEALTFAGTIAPAQPGQAVLLERQNPSGVGFQVVDTGTLGAGGSYSIGHTMSGAGTQVFRVKLPGGAEQQAAVSPTLKVQVTAAAAAVLAPQPPGATP
jgi:hypothetical protein